MGLIDTIRGFFPGSKRKQPEQPSINEYHEKSRLAESIIELVTRIKQINSFDPCLWNVSNVTYAQLMRRSLKDLQDLHSNLETRYSELTNNQNHTYSLGAVSLNEARWTGRKLPGMSDGALDRLQRGD